MDEPECVDLKKFVLNLAKDFAHNTLMYDYDEWTFSQTWVTWKEPGQQHVPHTHPNSVISGILYLKVDDDSGKLVFQNPTSMEGEVKEIKPKPGLLLMWPSFLMHGSGDTINKSKERIIIGFNSYWDKK